MLYHEGNKTFKLSDVGKSTFEGIKNFISKAPILVHLDYSKEFIIYYCALENTMSSILMQKNKERMQAPIAFMSMPLKIIN